MLRTLAQSFYREAVAAIHAIYKMLDRYSQQNSCVIIFHIIKCRPYTTSSIASYALNEASDFMIMALSCAIMCPVIIQYPFITLNTYTL